MGCTLRCLISTTLSLGVGFRTAAGCHVPGRPLEGAAHPPVSWPWRSLRPWTVLAAAWTCNRVFPEPYFGSSSRIPRSVLSNNQPGPSNADHRDRCSWLTSCKSLHGSAPGWVDPRSCFSKVRLHQGDYLRGGFSSTNKGSVFTAKIGL